MQSFWFFFVLMYNHWSLKQAKTFDIFFSFINQPHPFNSRQIDRQVLPVLIILKLSYFRYSLLLNCRGWRSNSVFLKDSGISIYCDLANQWFFLPTSAPLIIANPSVFEQSIAEAMNPILRQWKWRKRRSQKNPTRSVLWSSCSINIQRIPGKLSESNKVNNH